MSTIKERNLSYSMINEDEPPPKKLISDADRLIKELAEKQRNTATTLQEQLATPKEFTQPVELVPLANYNPGTSSLQRFQKTAEHFDKVEMLKAAGLSDEDLQLFFDSSRGDDYLFQKHKNSQKSILKRQLNEIQEKITQYEAHVEISKTKELEKHDLIECGLSVKPESTETKLLKFALNNEKAKNKATVLPHPMDNIKEIETNRFVHLNEPPLPSLNQIRRKARKLLNRINKVTSSNGDCKTVVRANEQKTNSLAKECKWDVREIKPETKIVENKTYTCLPQNYYTVKNGEIVKLSRDEAERKELEVTAKLSEEEIKRLPKFENYERGTPNKILYLKNLSKGIKEDHLKHLFKSYDKEKKLLYRLMNGRLRGQAFVTFPDETLASEALDEFNGVVLKNKPIVMQFASAKGKL